MLMGGITYKYEKTPWELFEPLKSKTNEPWWRLAVSCAVVGQDESVMSGIQTANYPDRVAQEKFLKNIV